MENLKVNNAVIGKQFEDSDNYKRFVKIIEEKNIKVRVVQAGEKFEIEKDLYFDVLWPDSNSVITDNVLNNNSLVCKLMYKNFSVLFTGDIQKIAENAILQKYQNTKVLRATIMKVAHHGSKSSSTEEFLREVNPKIVLIGVGKNNKFGHPNSDALERLIKRGSKVFRTDENGEITIQINKERKIWINKMLN
ncbi:MAG: hypothetical protein HFJ17_06035 [Clostridia bacterium]|nr:hypothetical protein [Clostridia bacterium]